MTVTFKKPLKPNWVASEIVNNFNFNAVYEELKSLPIVKNPTVIIYSLVVLTTDQEETPKWIIWDHSCHNSSKDFVDTYKEHISVLQERLDNKEITGYKTISTTITDNEGDSSVKFLYDYCDVKFNPKPKVYINGPKKNNEFLAKKAKQYATTNNI